jgi:hypothetical protein
VQPKHGFDTEDLYRELHPLRHETQCRIATLLAWRCATSANAFAAPGCSGVVIASPIRPLAVAATDSRLLC